MRRPVLWGAAVVLLVVVLLLIGFQVFGEGDVEPEPAGAGAPGLIA
ncbi:MAG: hypothetical protein H0V40_00535 [Actinobacteria bacterium]|nr:hypothetical protein [Actinomycetota bacterium]